MISGKDVEKIRSSLVSMQKSLDEVVGWLEWSMVVEEHKKMEEEEREEGKKMTSILVPVSTVRRNLITIFKREQGTLSFNDLLVILFEQGWPISNAGFKKNIRTALSSLVEDGILEYFDCSNKITTNSKDVWKFRGAEDVAPYRALKKNLIRIFKEGPGIIHFEDLIKILAEEGWLVDNANFKRKVSNTLSILVGEGFLTYSSKGNVLTYAIV